MRQCHGRTSRTLLRFRRGCKHFQIKCRYLSLHQWLSFPHTLLLFYRSQETNYDKVITASLSNEILRKRHLTKNHDLFIAHLFITPLKPFWALTVLGHRCKLWLAYPLTSLSPWCLHILNNSITLSASVCFGRAFRCWDCLLTSFIAEMPAITLPLGPGTATLLTRSSAHLCI